MKMLTHDGHFNKASTTKSYHFQIRGDKCVGLFCNNVKGISYDHKKLFFVFEPHTTARSQC